MNTENAKIFKEVLPENTLRFKGMVLFHRIVFTIMAIGLFATPVYGAEIIGIYFPPYYGADQPIIDLYDKAEKYIHLSIYSLTKDEIAAGLIRAHKRGLDVKVIIDKAQAGNKWADDEKLEMAGIEVRRDKAGGLMHNKFAVIDGIIVYTGSYNHSKSATLKHDENYIVIRDIGVAHIYETQFQKLWRKHQ